MHLDANREIKTILYEVFPDQSFAGEPFQIPTVDPKRTFLEKAFLLHQEFSKPTERIRHQSAFKAYIRPGKINGAVFMFCIGK
jgi:hypothetical protein